MFKIFKLGEVCSIESGSRGKGGASTEGIPSIGGEQISSTGYVLTEKMKYITEEHFKKMKQGVIKPDDTLLVKDGATTGKCAFYRNEYKEATVNEHVFILRANNLILPKFLYYVIASDKFQNKIKSNIKGIIGGINLSIKNLEIVIPDKLAEQQEIVQVLDTINDIIRLREECITHAQELIPALFQEMFGDPRKNPLNFKIKSLGELCIKIGSGATPKGGKETYQTNGIALVRSMNIYDMEFKYKDLAYINELQAEALNNVELKENDVLFNITGASIARCCILPKNVLPARVNQHVSILRCSEKVNHYFLNALLTFPSVKEQFLNLGKTKGATREAITKTQLESFKIILPDIDHQQQFAQKVIEIESYIKEQQEELENARLMFQSLLHHAFTGELTKHKYGEINE